jgi:ribonuclease HII
MADKKHPCLEWSFSHSPLEAGCDEAGRGCLAGPVVAAAVILGSPLPEINDSKKIGRRQRETLRIAIEKTAISYAVAFVTPERIDEINILNASIEAMHLALAALKAPPEFILVDGNKFKSFHNIPHLCIVRGDAKFQSIAAASILAKCHRDDYMNELHRKYPAYNWAVNKGYPTVDHVNTIKLKGSTKEHRRTFGIVKTLHEKTLFDL